MLLVSTDMKYEKKTLSISFHLFRKKCKRISLCELHLQ